MTEMGEFFYTVERRIAGSGQTMWKWEVRQRSGDQCLRTNINLSREMAERDALAAIQKLAAPEPERRASPGR